MLDLTCPDFNILIGSSDISLHVTGFSFRHPLAEPSTPLIWTGQIELDLTVDTTLGATFFDDEVNPARWLSGLQPIDVYFNSTFWQRFRIKPSGYRYDQTTGQAVVEITDIIGILDSYQPAADAPEFKTGITNRWTDLVVNLIRKQAELMGISVSLQSPTFNNDGTYTVPKTVRGSYIKEAQKIAGERQWWMWCDKEVIKWAKYPQFPSQIVWSKSRKETLTFSRQQGLDPVVTEVTVSATNEQVDTCKENYPRTYYTYVAANLATNTVGTVTSQRYQTISSRVTEDRYVTDAPDGQRLSTNDGRQPEYNVAIKTKQVVGNPALVLFGGQVNERGQITVNIPKIEGYTATKNGGYDWWIQYSKTSGGVTSFFDWNWITDRLLLLEKDVTIYEDVPFSSINASKLVSRTVVRSEPWAKYPDFMAKFGVSEWFAVDLNNDRRITERITTKYTYREIKRDDIIVAQGVKVYEIASIEEIVERIFLLKVDQGSAGITYRPLLVPAERTKTTYVKECLNRWEETKEIQINKGQNSSTQNQGFLFEIKKTVQDVFSIPEIEYRPAPFPVVQKPLLAKVSTGYAGVSPFVQSRDFVSASTLTSNAELAAYARWLGSVKWQRYYSREIASGYQTTLGYVPFQGAFAGNGAFIRDRFGISLNREGDSWQFVEDCIGNKYANIPEIAPPPIPFPPLLTSSLNIGQIPNLSVFTGVPINPINLAASGGEPPYSFSSGTLPSGLSISGAQIVGTPTAIATTSATITVTDDLGDTASTTFSLAVVASPATAAIVEVTQELANTWIEDAQIVFVGGLPIPIESTVDWVETATITLGGITSRLTNANKILLTNAVFSRLINRNSSGGGVAPISIYKAYWALEDIVGGFVANVLGDTDYDLVATTGSSTSGKVDNCILDLEASLSTSLPDRFWDLSSNDFVGFALWVAPQIDGSGQTDIIINGGTFFSWKLTIDFDNSLIILKALQIGTGAITVSDSITIDDWNLVICEMDKTAETITIKVNNGTKQTTSAPITGNTFVAALNISAIPTKLDEFFFYDTPLDSGQESAIWNFGSGSIYPPF